MAIDGLERAGERTPALVAVLNGAGRILLDYGSLIALVAALASLRIGSVRNEFAPR